MAAKVFGRIKIVHDPSEQLDISDFSAIPHPDLPVEELPFCFLNKLRGILDTCLLCWAANPEDVKDFHFQLQANTEMVNGDTLIFFTERKSFFDVYANVDLHLCGLAHRFADLLNTEKANISKINTITLALTPYVFSFLTFKRLIP